MVETTESAYKAQELNGKIAATDVDTQLKNLKENIEKDKKKSITAWSDIGEKRTFGIWGFFKFLWPRLWTKGCWPKFMVLFNVSVTFVWKFGAILVPLLLKETIDAIICEEGKERDTDKLLLKLSGDDGCPEPKFIYMLIVLYGVVKYITETINFMRGVPFASMAAIAEISIARDVYDHL
jgi:hypothetical protein